MKRKMMNTEINFVSWRETNNICNCFEFDHRDKEVEIRETDTFPSLRLDGI